MMKSNFESAKHVSRIPSPERGFGHVFSVAGLGALGAIALAMLSGRMPSAEDPGVLRCTLLELVDDQGEVVASLGMDDDGHPRLQLRQGSSHATLAISADSAGLAAGAPGGVSYLGIANGSPYVNFRGKNLKNGIWAGVTPDGAAGFRAYGESLKVGVQLEVDDEGKPVLRLADSKGRTTWEPDERSGRGR